MAKTVAISVKKDEQEIIEWVEDRVEDGTFRSKSHAFCQGIKRLKESEVNEYNV